MNTEEIIKVKNNDYKDYPKNHKRLLVPEDCKVCDMRQTYFCKEYCINALIEKK
jgi:hypothetical protein